MPSIRCSYYLVFLELKSFRYVPFDHGLYYLAICFCCVLSIHCSHYPVIWEQTSVMYPPSAVCITRKLDRFRYNYVSGLPVPRITLEVMLLRDVPFAAPPCLAFFVGTNTAASRGGKTSAIGTAHRFPTFSQRTRTFTAPFVHFVLFQSSPPPPNYYFFFAGVRVGVRGG